MKRIVNVFFAVILAAALLIGCGAQEELSMEGEQLDIKLSLEEGLDTFPQYADEETLLLSLEKSRKVNVGPASAT